MEKKICIEKNTIFIRENRTKKLIKIYEYVQYVYDQSFSDN